MCKDRARRRQAVFVAQHIWALKAMEEKMEHNAPEEAVFWSPSMDVDEDIKSLQLPAMFTM